MAHRCFQPCRAIASSTATREKSIPRAIETRQDRTRPLKRPQRSPRQIARASSRATVVCVHVPPPPGASTPRSVNARASACIEATPSSRSRSTSSSSRCSATSPRRCQAPRQAGGPPVPAQTRATRLGRRQRRPGALADQFALLPRHRRVNPHRQIVRPRACRRPGSNGRPPAVATACARAA